MVFVLAAKPFTDDPFATMTLTADGGNVDDATVDVVATPVAPAAGVVLVTVGGVVSAAAVVNDHVFDGDIVLPAVSFTPLTVAV